MEQSFLRQPVPGSLQQQIFDDLLHRIGTELGPGVMLPSESALCAEYGVSRITVRAALAKLVERGLLIRRRGIGTVVAGREQTARSFSLLGYLDEIRSHTYRVKLIEVQPAPDHVAEALRINPGNPVHHLRCVVERDREALTISESWTPEGSGHELTEVDLEAGMPSVQAMARRVGERIERAEQVLEAIALEQELAALLDLPAGVPVMRARRTYLATGERRVQYAEISYHPSRFRFDVDLVMRGEPGDAPPSRPSGGKGKVRKEKK